MSTESYLQRVNGFRQNGDSTLSLPFHGSLLLITKDLVPSRQHIDHSHSLFTCTFLHLTAASLRTRPILPIRPCAFRGPHCRRRAAADIIAPCMNATPSWLFQHGFHQSTSHCQPSSVHFSCTVRRARDLPGSTLPSTFSPCSPPSLFPGIPRPSQFTCYIYKPVG
jgi:hypothetical protein